MSVSFVLLGLLLLCTGAFGQPAYVTKKPQPFEYELQINGDDVFCVFSTLDCFQGPVKQFKYIDKPVLTRLTDKDGWKIKLPDQNWEHEITKADLEAMSYDQTWGRNWRDFHGKNVMFHRYVSLELKKPAYMPWQGNPAGNGISLDLKSCFTDTSGFVVIKGAKIEYLVHQNWHFIFGMCLRPSDTSRGYLKVTTSSSADQQSIECENLLTYNKFPSFKYFEASKYNQIVVRYGSQQYTMQTRSCKLIQADAVANAAVSTKEHLYFSARSGWGNDFTGFFAIRKLDKNHPLGGQNEYFLYCVPGKGAYVDTNQPRVSSDRIQALDSKLTLVINVDARKSSSGSNQRGNGSHGSQGGGHGYGNHHDYHEDRHRRSEEL